MAALSLRSRLPLLLLFLLALSPREDVWAATSETDAATSDAEPAAEDAAEEPPVRTIRWFPPRLYYGGVFYLPQLTYSDRRGLGFGGEALYPFRWPGTTPDVPASDLEATGRITLKSQVQLEVATHLHPSRDYFLNVKLSYETLFERYYGIGPDTPSSAEEAYQPRRLDAYVEVLRQVHGRVHLGVRAEVERVDLLETEEHGALAGGAIRGARGGEQALGAGLVFDWDQRSGRGYDTRGFWLQGFGLFFDEELGSDFDFNNYHFDARGYLSPGEDQVVALQLFTYAARGGPPFWHYAELGGRAHSRGYRRGRYRDRVLVAAQVEYRRQLFWRIGAAGFVGLADVAPTLRDLQLEHMRPSFGGGPRILLGGPSQGLTVRFDVGFGGDVPRYYFSLQEAF